ncbi:MAG TPA: hypothetical protein VGI13_11550 [Candidatus Acidoferrum sp.]
MCEQFGSEHRNAIEPLKTKAREIGANGIIIDKSQPIKSGIISTGIYAEARAIRREKTKLMVPKLAWRASESRPAPSARRFQLFLAA